MTTSRFVFTSAEDLWKHIVSALDEAEKRAKARTLPRERLGEVVEAVASQPYGYVTGDGGGVANSYRYAAETTHFTLAWYSWRGRKHIFLSASRGYAEKVAYGASGYLRINVDAGDRRQAYKMVLPDRARRFNHLMNLRKIRNFPPMPSRAEVREVRVEGDLARVYTTEGDFIATPSGWLKIPLHASRGKKNAWQILAGLGFPVPRRNRAWNEKLAAYAAMYVIGGGDRA